MQIDSESGARYYHAQGNYFLLPIYTESGACRYKLVDGRPVKCTIEEIAAKEEALKLIPVPEEISVWDELNVPYREGTNSI